MLWKFDGFENLKCDLLQWFALDNDNDHDPKNHDIDLTFDLFQNQPIPNNYKL